MNLIEKETSELARALLDFMIECPNIPKDQEDKRPKFSYQYASLTSIITLITPTLKKVGLSFMQCIGADAHLHTRVIHIESGQYVDSSCKIIYEENDPQSFGGGLTTAKRQSLCTMLGLVPEEKENVYVENKRPWLNQKTKSWAEAVTWMASSPDASIEKLEKKYRISKANAVELQKQSDEWALKSQ